jgi:hypothetical protein
MLSILKGLAPEKNFEAVDLPRDGSGSVTTP